MPTMTGEVIIGATDISIDFEAYCSCGNGICSNVNTRNSRNRRFPQIEVTPCEKCIENAKEEGAESMKDTISELESEIEQLKKELSEKE